MTADRSSEVDLPKFSAMLEKKRGKRTLRELAQEIQGVSASTLSRITKGNVPDLDTFLKVCRWLEVSPQDFQADAPTAIDVAYSTADVVCAHLRADRTLPPDTAKALVTMIQLAYKDISDGALGSEDDE